VLQFVAVCCSVLQCVAVSCRACGAFSQKTGLFCQGAGLCCSVLQCVAVCCSVLQYVAVCCRECQCVAVVAKRAGAFLIEFRALLSENRTLLDRKQVSFEYKMYRAVLKCGVVCCSVLQCVADCVELF